MLTLEQSADFKYNINTCRRLWTTYQTEQSTCSERLPPSTNRTRLISGSFCSLEEWVDNRDLHTTDKSETTTHPTPSGLWCREEYILISL